MAMLHHQPQGSIGMKHVKKCYDWLVNLIINCTLFQIAIIVFGVFSGGATGRSADVPPTSVSQSDLTGGELLIN